ncbi:MAG: hypothetical protein DMF96_05640 [Acidobacteria bacterium]|nr:MAG: hypothetical protein DMF96_05640 [Acidobacteriota bacterium]
MVSFDTPHRHSFNPSSSKGINMRGFVAVALSLTLTLVQAAPLMAAPAMRAARAGGGQPGATGTLNGTAQSSTGQTLPNFTVQVRNLKTGELVGTTTSNSAGSFSFTGLSPADYVVEVVNQAGAIVGSSAAVTLAAGATVTVTVSAMAAAAIATAAAGGISTALVVTTIAAGAGIAGVVVAVKHDASPSR